MIGTDAFQETDVFGVTLSLTKWSRLVRTIDEIPEVIAEGFYWARSGRPGPVVIDIPTDILKAKKEFSGPVKFTPHARPADAKADGAFTDTIVALLQRATKPVALVGAGAKLSGAIPELRRLLDDLNVPTFATVHGLGAVPPQSPYYLGMVGMHGTRAANTALHETDLLMVFGARLDDRVTGDPTRFAPNAKIVHFEIDPAQLDRVRACDVPVIGNLADTIPAFHAEAAQDFPSRLERLARRRLRSRSARSLIPEGWRSRRFVFSTNFSAACRKTAWSSPTWASTRCGRRSVTALRRRAASLLRADWARWASLCPQRSACNWRSRILACSAFPAMADFR